MKQPEGDKEEGTDLCPGSESRSTVWMWVPFHELRPAIGGWRKKEQGVVRSTVRGLLHLRGLRPHVWASGRPAAAYK